MLFLATHIQDRLLLRLKSRGSRVLLFSQWSETLDLLEEYIQFRFGEKNQAYLRLDGQTSLITRELDRRAFNLTSNNIFVYLMTTSAGRNGINLTGADSVVMYDSSLNPLVDFQAQERCHRLGQNSKVTVYKLITLNSVEKRMCDIAERKSILDHFLLSKPLSDQHNCFTEGIVVNEGDVEVNPSPSSSMRTRATKKVDDTAKKPHSDSDAISISSVLHSFRCRFGDSIGGSGDIKMSLNEVWKTLRYGGDAIFQGDVKIPADSSLDGVVKREAVDNDAMDVEQDTPMTENIESLPIAELEVLLDNAMKGGEAIDATDGGENIVELVDGVGRVTPEDAISSIQSDESDRLASAQPSFSLTIPGSSSIFDSYQVSGPSAASGSLSPSPVPDTESKPKTRRSKRSRKPTNVDNDDASSTCGSVAENVNKDTDDCNRHVFEEMIPLFTGLHDKKDSTEVGGPLCVAVDHHRDRISNGDSNISSSVCNEMEVAEAKNGDNEIDVPKANSIDNDQLLDSQRSAFYYIMSSTLLFVIDKFMLSRQAKIVFYVDI